MSSKALRRARKRSVRRMKDDFREEAMNTPTRRDVQEDPRVVVLSSRVRQGAKDAEDAARPMWGEQAGIAIKLGAVDDDEANRLWETFKRIDSADETFTRRKIGIRRFPNVAKLELLPEVMETRADDRPDTRTQEQKDIDAVNDWSAWSRLLGLIGDDAHIAIVSALRQRSVLAARGSLTWSGRDFVQAMRALDAVYQRR